MAVAPAYLVAGPEEILVRREAERVVEEVGGSDAEITDLRAEEVKEQGLPDLTGSLFGGRRVVRIRDAQDLPATVVEAVLKQLDNPAPDATLVLQASGTGRIRKLAKRVDELGGRIDVAPPKEWEERKWLALVGDEFARHGRDADGQARQALLEHAGLDVSAVAAKVAQVVSAVARGKVTAEQVETVVVGHGDRGAFAVADAMCERDAARAMALLRGVLDGGSDPVMVLGALAYRLRALVAVAGGIDGKEIGASISQGQARRLGGMRRNFGPGELTRAYRALAEADVAIKSGVAPPEHAIEQVVAEVATPAGRAGS